MPFPLYIQGYGTANFNTASERDIYQSFLNLFTPNGMGVYEHTNMDSEVRLTKNNPLLNAEIDHIGLPKIPLLPITISTWDATYPQGVSPVINIKKKFVDRISSNFDQDYYYSQTNPVNCAIPCEIYIGNYNSVYVWDYTPAPLHLTAVNPLNGGESIATSGNGKWYIFVDDGGNYVIQEWTRNPNTCDSTLTRTINNPGVPGWNASNYSRSICATSRNTTIIIGGGNGVNAHYISEYNISGTTAVVTPLFRQANTNPPPGQVRATNLGGLLYLQMFDQLVATEMWTTQGGVSTFQIVVRDRSSGTVICNTPTNWTSTPAGTWGLFCWDSQMFGLKYDSSGAQQGIFQIFYDDTIPAITYNPTFLWPHTGGDAATGPSCCGGAVIAPITVAGYCCTDSSGNSIGICSNATANCGGNNSDGQMATVLECITNCPINNGTWVIEVTDSNGIVINSLLGNSGGPFTQVSTQFNGLDPDTYIVRYYNMILDGVAHADLNVSCLVLGDTPWTCATNLACCAPMWNCTQCNCYQVSGAGQYATEAECLANCCIPPAPAEDDCSDFNVCIPCEDTLIY